MRINRECKFNERAQALKKANTLPQDSAQSTTQRITIETSLELGRVKRCETTARYSRDIWSNIPIAPAQFTGVGGKQDELNAEVNSD